MSADTSDKDVEKQTDAAQLEVEEEVASTASSDHDAASNHSVLHPVSSQDIATADPHADDPYWEAGDEIYEKFSPHRKLVITAVVSFSSFLVPIASTSILSATPEVAHTFHSNGTVIGVSNACFLLGMGFAPLFWGPAGQVWGRRWTSFASAFLFACFSVATALSPNLAAYFIFRILTACNGTSFLIIGASCISDIYKPTERATAYCWFLSGTLVGPSLGPLMGGIIVTYAGWRDIFWLQAALGFFATLLVLFFLPETAHKKRSTELQGLTVRSQAAKLWHWTNPWRVLKLLRYPNLIAVGMASAALVWNMYSFLTPIRYVVDPRFHLTSPVQAGLFYIAPGGGYLLGTFFGGRWADWVVKRYIRNRGERIPEDRLRAAIPFMLLVAGCMLIYGWVIEKKVGGIPLPVVVMFLQGFFQLFCFPSINTYCLDVNKERASEVVGCNYVVRYLFGAAGTTACLPAIQAFGVGWFSTISAAFLVGSTGLVYLTALYGQKWRDAVPLSYVKSNVG